ncbi:MAG: chemotaxis protein CheW [Cyclobacteriaceae bacterium]
MEEITPTTTGSYLTFKLDNEHFAVSVMQVTELLEMLSITKVPRSPEAMRGVINLRGSVVPVVDMRVKFSLTPKEDDIDTCIVVLNLNLENEDLKVGAIVDSVSEVIEINNNEIIPLPSISKKNHTEFISGVIEQQELFIMVLDAEKIFSTDKLLQIQKTEEILSLKG